MARNGLSLFFGGKSRLAGRISRSSSGSKRSEDEAKLDCPMVARFQTEATDLPCTASGYGRFRRYARRSFSAVHRWWQNAWARRVRHEGERGCDVQCPLECRRKWSFAERNRSGVYWPC